MPGSSSNTASTTTRRRALCLLGLVIVSGLAANHHTNAEAFRGGWIGGGRGGSGSRSGWGAGGGGGAWMSAIRESLVPNPLQSKGSMLRLPQQAMVSELLQKGPVAITQREFLINGWRWHARSVLRDVGRFKHVAAYEKRQSISSSSSSSSASSSLRALRASLPAYSRLPSCYDFFWGFSWEALMKIEAEIFYPFLRKVLPKDMRPVLDELEFSRRTVADLGRSLGVVCQSLSTSSKKQGGEIVDRVGKLDKALAIAQEMETKARDLIDRQERIVVPIVAAYVTSRDQKRFNNKVIAKLGLFNSRVHLVSMAEAVAGDNIEEAKFKKQIPSIAQAFIPRWRQKLYIPLAKDLELKV